MIGDLEGPSLRGATPLPPEPCTVVVCADDAQTEAGLVRALRDDGHRAVRGGPPARAPSIIRLAQPEVVLLVATPGRPGVGRLVEEARASAPRASILLVPAGAALSAFGGARGWLDGPR